MRHTPVLAPVVDELALIVAGYGDGEPEVSLAAATASGDGQLGFNPLAGSDAIFALRAPW